MKIKSLLILLFLPILSIQAQTTKEEIMQNISLAGGNYYSYPTPTGKLTPAPKGYKPFYVSHYGRHGSRYITSDRHYKFAIALLDSARQCHVLSPLGNDILNRLNKAYNDAYQRDGELSKLGAKQHQEIASRMYRNYPEIFSKPISIDARASIIMRCVLSMSNFCQQLRSLNPNLKISMDASKRDMWYIANGEDDSIVKNPNEKRLRERLEEFKKRMFNPERQMSLLFTNHKFIEGINSSKLMDCFYNIAEDMQCQPQLHLSFSDLFNKQELFDIWQYYNASWCYWSGFYPSGSPYYKEQYHLLNNILETADNVIKSGQTTATLRFGHDSMVAPLAYAMHLKGCDHITDNIDSVYSHWANFKVIPMAGNIQIVFYRKPGNNDILVKFLLNEHETSIPIKTDSAPYYHWKDVETFYRAELKK